MGRTIASITQTWQQEEAALKRFQRALRKEDQILLDELLALSRLHLAEASYASNLYPMDMYLIAILMEVYKQVKVLQKQLRQTVDPQMQLNSGKEEAFIQLLNETVSVFMPNLNLENALPAHEEPDPADQTCYAEFEEAP